MQKPHCTAPALRNSSCRSVSPSADSPSTVVTSCPSASTQRTRQEFTALPSSSTVQAPHSPSAQQLLVPGSPTSSRRPSRRVRCGGDGDRPLAAVDGQRDRLQLVVDEVVGYAGGAWSRRHLPGVPAVRRSEDRALGEYAERREPVLAAAPDVGDRGGDRQQLVQRRGPSAASSARSTGPGDSVRSGRGPTAPIPSTSPPSGPTPAATLTVARSTPRRRVSRRKAEPEPGAGRGRSIRVTSSPGPHSVRRGPRKNSSSDAVRSPSRDAMVTRAPCTSSGGAVSAAGEALHEFATRLARLRMATDPTVSAASTSAGYHSPIDGVRDQLAEGVRRRRSARRRR